jgi:hypothetical protein
VPGLALQDTLKTGAIFEAKGVHGFRITLKKYQAPAPAGSSGGGDEGDG